MKRNYRQGDLFFRRIDKIPATAKRSDNPVLARGEATGHDHVLIDGEVYVDADGRLYVRATESTRCRHQDQAGTIAEHEPLALELGEFAVTIERDYAPESERRVID